MSVRSKNKQKYDLNSSSLTKHTSPLQESSLTNPRSLINKFKTVSYEPSIMSSSSIKAKSNRVNTQKFNYAVLKKSEKNQDSVGVIDKLNSSYLQHSTSADRRSKILQDLLKIKKVDRNVGQLKKQKSTEKLKLQQSVVYGLGRREVTKLYTQNSN